MIIAPNPIPAPSLSIIALNETSLKISWDKLSESMSYNLFRSSYENGNYTLIHQKTSDTTFIDNNLSPNKRYFYKIQGENSKSKGLISSPKGAYTIPPAPSGSTSMPLESESVLVAWNLVQGIDEYQLYRSASKDSGFGLIKSNLKSIAYNDTSVKCETTYFYKIKSVIEGNKSQYSNFTKVTTPSKIPSIPGNPSTNLINNGSGIEISWNPSDCAHSYNIYRSINNSKFEFVENTNNLDFKDLNLKNAQYYSYRVTGISKAGEGGFSSQSINLLTRPDSPTNIESDLVSSNSIALNWSPQKHHLVIIYTFQKILVFISVS